MKIFLTGATGYIGSVVAEKLKQKGHSVLALARSENAVEKLRERGYEALKGALEDTITLSQGADQADGVIHLAQMRFDPDKSFMSQMKTSSELQLTSVNAMIKGLGYTKKPFIITGGTGAYRDTGRHVVNEDTPVKAPPIIKGLAQAETNVLTSNDIRGMAIRPGIVFGRNAGPVMQVLEKSKSRGFVEMTSKGNNLLSLVHVEDVADLYLLMLKKAEAGTLLNAVAEPFLSQREILEAISQRLGFEGKVKQKSMLMQTANMLMGKGSYNIFGNNMQVSSERARKLGWKARPATSLFEELNRT